MARLSPVSIIAGSILAGISLLAPLGAAQAQTKIAVVNVPRLLDEAPQAKSAMQALQDEFAPRQKEIVAQQKDLKAKEEKLNRDGAVMAENERRNEEIGKLQRSLLQEVQAFARTSSYDLIVGEGVLYVNESMDITAQVLSALQARYKATGGAAPKPATPKPATPPPPQSKPQQ